MSGDPLVSIVIVNWNGRAWLARCLESLRTVDYSRVECIVVDNGSTDGTRELLDADFPDVKLISLNRNAGHAEGLNIGTRAARGDLILHLDNDVRVHDPGFLAHLVRLMRSDARIGACGPMVLDMDSSVIQFLGEHIKMPLGGKFQPVRGIGETDTGQYAEPFDVDYIRGCAVLFRRSVLDEVGLYYAPYVVYFDEADLCLSIKEAGYRVVTEPRAKIMHRVGGDGSNPSDAKLYLVVRNQLLFMRRRGSVLGWLVFLPRFLTNPVSWYGRRFLFRQPLRVGRLIARAVWWNIADSFSSKERARP